MDMNLKRRIGALVSAGIISVTALAGCGTDNSSSDPQDTRVAELEERVAELEDLLAKDGQLGYNYDDNSISEVGQTERVNYDFTDAAKELYQETIDKNSYVLRYQQIVNINWNEDLALEVIELMNGVYPTRMREMSPEDAQAEMTEVLQATSLLITGNLNPETKEEDMIDLSKYVLNDKDRVLIHNSMVVARNAMNESVGEPMNGQILEESDWAMVNKFSDEYKGAVDQLLHYEFGTINDSDFLEMNAGARWIVATTFQQVNNTIPQWSYITRRSSEATPREYDLYYRYFTNDVEKKVYLPRPGVNGTVEYVWTDENCIEREVYTLDEMFALAGLSTVEEQRNLGIVANPNVHQLGIQTEVDNRVDDATAELYAAQKTYVIR